MEQYEQIIAIGCSFTYGHETAGPDLWTVEDPSRAWPAHLGQLLNIPVTNLAMCGASNEWIYYKLSSYLIKNPPTQPSLVLVQWSLFDRILAIHPENSANYACVSPTTIESHSYVNNYLPSTFIRNYVEFLAVDPRNVLNTLYNTVLLGQLLSAHGHGFYYWPANSLAKSLPGLKSIPEIYWHMVDEFERGSIIDRNYDWHPRLHNRGPSGGHFSTECHMWWAEQVFEYLKTGNKIA